MADIAGLTNLGALAAGDKTVRVSVPLAVANNLAAMQKVTANVLKHLGCEGCHSGHDIRYDVVREFTADAQGNVQHLAR
jgi:hypothetical protein